MFVMARTYRQEFELTTRAAAGSDTVELSFSSETPVDRGDYREVLDHSPESVDLSRLNDGSHPLLVNHDVNQVPGVVVRAWVGSDRRGHARVKFSRSALGREVLQDVSDGIRRLVSVGYRITKQLSRELVDGVETVRFAWQPYEISIVSVPADPSVGIGRSLVTESLHNMNAENSASEILAIGKNLQGKVSCDSMAAAYEAVQRGYTVEQFRSEMLQHLPSVKPMEKPLLSEVKPADWRRYSISRAIRSIADRGGVDGFEREMSEEIALKTGQRPGGFWLPQEALARNFIAGTGTLGGMVVETSNLGDQFIELLRNRAQVVNLGARVLNLNNPITVPRQNAAGTANWVAETAAATLSTGNFTQITLTPYAVSAFQQYSKQLLAVGNPSIDSLIRDDINQIIALAIDRAALHGTGSGQPTGIAGTTGINTVSVAYLSAAGLTTSLYPFLVSLETEVATDNADSGSIGYLMRAAERSACKTTPEFTNGERPVWTGPSSGTVAGYRAEVSNQIAGNLTHGTATTIATAVFFGNWNDLLIAQFSGGATDLVVDPFSRAENGVVRVIARKWVDIGVRHPESFCLGVGLIA